MVSNKRKKLEELKTLELQNKKCTALTQEAAAEATQSQENLKKQLKEAVAASNTFANPTKTTSVTKPKKRKATKKGKSTKSKSRTTTVPGTSEFNLPQLDGTKQGLRIVPQAKDKYGCKHTGLRDMITLNRAHLKAYANKDGWLYNRPCYDCASKEPGQNRILEMINLLEKGKRSFGCYCNCGPRGHGMKEDDPNKPNYVCNLVLCPGCFEIRDSKMSSSTSGKRTRGAASGM